MINIRQIGILARYILIEALYARLFLILFAFIGMSIGLDLFLGHIALFEKSATQTSLVAAFLRLGAVYLIGLFVISSISQEFNQQNIYLLMALPLSRTTYVLGKWLGFSILALITCILLSLQFLFYHSDVQLLFWLISLYFELLLTISVALFFSFTFHHTLPALSALIGFYLLSRSIYTIQLMAYEFQNSTAWLEQSLYYLTQLIALLLPDLSRFTRSEWLIYQTGQWEMIIELLIQTMIYLFLILSASLFDFYRKNL